MNYGQSQAVMVLAGERMGFLTGNTENARAVLEGKPMHPTFGAALEKLATELHEKIHAQVELVNQANKHCEDLIAEYGLDKKRMPDPSSRQPSWMMVELPEAGCVLGMPYQDWPENLTSFEDRKIYQLGVAHGKAVQKHSDQREHQPRIESLAALYVAIRDNHQGRLPPQIQAAYEKVGQVLKEAVDAEVLNM